MAEHDHEHDHNHDHDHDHDHGDTTATAEKPAEKPAQKVTVEDIGPARKCLTIEIPPERIAGAMEKSYEKLRTDAAVPGFRRGRVPQRLLEKRFGDSVRDDIRGQLISESYSQAIEDQGLRVLGDPDVKDMDQIKLPDSGALTIKVEIEVAPEVSLPAFEELTVQKAPVAVGDDALAEELTRYQERFGKMVEADADARIAERDYLQTAVQVVDKDGQEILSLPDAPVLVTGKERDYKGHVAGIIINDLGQQLKGKTVGDKLDITMVGPASHENEKIKDQPITIHLAVQKIQRVEPAALENLAKQFGVDSVDDLKKQIRDMLESRAERQQQSNLHEQIIEQLMEKVPLELPPGITGRQTDRMLHRERMELKYRDTPEHEIEQKLAEKRGESEEAARRELKQFFVLDAAAKQLQIEVAENELNGRIAMMAMQQGRRPEKVRQEMYRSGELEYLYMQMREQKTLDAILAKAKVTEVSAAAMAEAAGKSKSGKSAGKSKAKGKEDSSETE